MVDRLSRAGLVDRRRSDADRRNVFVYATDKGRDLHRQVRPRVDATYAELRGSIDKDEWRVLMNGLERIALLENETSADRPAVNQ